MTDDTPEEEETMCGGTVGKWLGIKSAKMAAPVMPPTSASKINPIEADASSKTAGDQEKKRRRAATGRSDTILTSGLGVTGTANVGKKKLSGAE